MKTERPPSAAPTRLLVASWLLATTVACGATSTARAPRSTSGSRAYPLLDGRCDEYPALAAERHAVTPGVELFVFQDRDYVWLCYTLPSDAFGALDMVLSAPTLHEPRNLHVSAQLGEWPANTPDAVPKSASSPLWWNQHGWSALPVPFNGTRADGTVQFRPTPGRELQLGKARFGRGTWHLRMQIHGVGPRGSDAHFPESGDYGLTVW